MKASQQHEEAAGDLESAEAPLLDKGHAKVHAEQQERIFGLPRVVVAGGTWCLMTSAMVRRCYRGGSLAAAPASVAGARRQPGW